MGETTHLTWRDVDFERGEIRVTTKRATPETIALLTEMQGYAPDGRAYVFLPKHRLKALHAAEDAGKNVEGIVPLRGVQSQFYKRVVRASKPVQSLANRDHNPRYRSTISGEAVSRIGPGVSRRSRRNP